MSGLSYYVRPAVQYMTFDSGLPEARGFERRWVGRDTGCEIAHSLTQRLLEQLFLSFVVYAKRFVFYEALIAPAAILSGVGRAKSGRAGCRPQSRGSMRGTKAIRPCKAAGPWMISSESCDGSSRGVCRAMR